MPEAITKYALNSTLGTDSFKPLDQLKQFLESENLLLSLVENSSVSIGPSSILVPSSYFRFESQLSGSAKIKGSVTSYQGAQVQIWVDGEIYGQVSAPASGENFEYVIKLNKDSIVDILFDESVYVKDLGIYADVIDIPKIYLEKVVIDGTSYVKTTGGYTVSSREYASVEHDEQSVIRLKNEINGVGVIEISPGAFAARLFSKMVIGQGMQRIENDAFMDCHNLITLFLPNTIKKIGQNAFSGCELLSEIRVEWDEGAVEGAPWGAPGTTQILYNQTR